MLRFLLGTDLLFPGALPRWEAERKESESVGCNIPPGEFCRQFVSVHPCCPAEPPSCNMFIYLLPKREPDAGIAWPFTYFFLLASCNSVGRVHLGGGSVANRHT